MQHRGRLKAVAHIWNKTLRPFHATYKTTLHDHSEKPGLTALSDEGKDNGIAWFLSGPKDASADTLTVVFIHGYGLSAESFYDQVGFLQKSHPQVRALLVDVRGHGLSDTVPMADYTIEGAADDVLGVIQNHAAQGKLLIVGHSLGGMVAQNLIKRAPQDVYDRISAVLLIATAMQAFSQKGLASILRLRVVEWFFDSACCLPGKINRIRWDVAKFLAPVFAAVLTGFPQTERLQFHVNMILDTPVRAFAGFFDELVDHAEFGAASRLAPLDGIVMVGSLDIVTPQSQSETILKHWPTAELCVVDGAGHMVILEEPEEVSTALEKLLQRSS